MTQLKGNQMVEPFGLAHLRPTTPPLRPTISRPQGGGQYACPRATLAGRTSILTEGIHCKALPKGLGFPC